MKSVAQSTRASQENLHNVPNTLAVEGNSLGQAATIQPAIRICDCDCNPVTWSDVVDPAKAGQSRDYFAAASNRVTTTGGARLVQNIGAPKDNPLQRQSSGEKVSRNHLSELMKWILLNAGDGIDRGTVIERFYRLERRYCGYDADLCLRGKQKRDYERRYRRAQPVVTRSINRLAKRGLVNPIKPGSYVKLISLTEKGKAVAESLLRNQ